MARERERELLEENARMRNEMLALRRKAAAWDALKVEARCANIYSHLEPEELQRVVAAIEARYGA